jgi:NTE family protein
MLDFIENVLVLQGGGSLGAFGCGVYKALAANGVRLDIIAGTSIGGVNASIIAGSKEREPEKALEAFWLELAESTVTGNDVSTAQWLSGRLFFGRPPDPATSAFLKVAAHGNDRIFLPRWRPEYASTDPHYFTPEKWTYIYDHSPLSKTLERYIDYDKLRPGGHPNARLIMSAVNVMTAEPLTFDCSSHQITPKHILATSGYPLYYLPWVEIESGVYAWDGSLLSNTPLREVIDASPVNDKRVIIVENYPKKIDKLPDSIPGILHRARDIIFSDKTQHNVQMSKVITYYLRFIDELYGLVERHLDPDALDEDELARIRRKYKKISEEHGAEITSITYVTRDEPNPSLYENADFSVSTIKSSIKEGEEKTNAALKKIALA